MREMRRMREMRKMAISESEFEKITSEILYNTHDFLKAEFTIQLKEMKLNFSDNINILTHVIINLFINHIINISEMSEASPIKILEEINLQKLLKNVMEKKNET
jgi:hypothetical protein